MSVQGRSRKYQSHTVPGEALPVGRILLADVLVELARHPAGLLATLLALLALVAIVYLVQVSQVATLGYRLDQAQAREFELRVEAEMLRTAIAEYEDPRRIERVAREQLGLIKAQHVIYLKVDGLDGKESPSRWVTNRWWASLSGLNGE